MALTANGAFHDHVTIDHPNKAWRRAHGMKETQQDTAIGSSTQKGPLARPTVRRAPLSEVMHMRATIGIFRRHLWAFLMVAAIVPACGWLAVNRTTPRFTATGSLIYDPSEYKV